MAYDGLYYYHIFQTKRSEGILPNNLKTANFYYYINVCDLFTTSWLFNLRPTNLHFVMLIKIKKTNSIFLASAYL